MRNRTGAYLCRNESHSRRKRRIVFSPCWSEPQCSKPKLLDSKHYGKSYEPAGTRTHQYIFNMSSLSEAEMSQCLRSFISVGSQGLMSAPRAIIAQEHRPIASGSVSFKWLSSKLVCAAQSSHERMSPFPMMGMRGRSGFCDRAACSTYSQLASLAYLCVRLRP